MKKLIVLVLGAFMILAGYGSAHAFGNYLTDPGTGFNALYPSAGSISNCGLCHVNPGGGGSRNSFGSAFSSNGHSYTAIENLDSDGDGFTNKAEITSVPPTSPGNAASHPALTCSSFTYSAFGACQSNNTQTRTVISSLPAGCTGGTPVLSQACTFVPPVTACTSFTYSAFGACQSNNTQTRTVISSLPAGCTGGTPVLSQACTFVPPVTACTSFTYSAFGACQSNNTQTRTVASSSPAGCTGGTPLLTQICNYVPPVTACTSFTYSAFGACQSNNTQTRTVASSSPAGCTGGTPLLTQICNYVPPVTACTSFTYSAFGACQSNNTQTRTVASSSPAGCTGGTPALSQACTYVPPVTPPTTDAMPLPTSEDKFEYTAVANPVVSTDPDEAKPIGVGPLATGGKTIDLKVNVGPFEKPVNVSFFIYAPAVDSEDLYYMDKNKEMRKLSDTVGEIERESLSSSAVAYRGDASVPSSKKFRKLSFWKTDVTSVNEQIYKGPLAPGYYALVLVVKSADNDEDYYSWTTHILVPQDTNRVRNND